MKAGIAFDIYEDFTTYSNMSKALRILNKKIKKYIKQEILVFKYKGIPVKVKLPITLDAVGNIFGEDDFAGAHWNEVIIWCNISNPDKDFNIDELKVTKYPVEFHPTTYYY